MKRVAAICLLLLAAAAPALAGDAPPTGGVSKLPKQTLFVEATYPPDAAAAGLEADVVLNLTIDVDRPREPRRGGDVGGPRPRSFRCGSGRRRHGYLFEPAESDGQARRGGTGLQGEVSAADQTGARSTPGLPATGRTRRRPAPPREPGRTAARARDAQPPHRRGGHRDQGGCLTSAGVRGDQRR